MTDYEYKKGMVDRRVGSARRASGSIHEGEFLDGIPMEDHGFECRIQAIKNRKNSRCICGKGLIYPSREQAEFQVVLGYPNGKMVRPIPDTTFSSAKDAETSGMPLLWSDPIATEMFIVRVEAAFRKTISKTL